MSVDTQSQEKKPGPVLAESAEKFVRSLRDNIPLEKARHELRATPHGFFVHKDFLPEVLRHYQVFLERLSAGEADTSVQKCMRRLFGSEDPALSYLVEAKRCFVGHLIPFEMKQPELSGLPVYLGSLSDAQSTIHPRDPFLLLVPGLQAEASPGGLKFRIDASTTMTRDGATRGGNAAATHVIFDLEFLKSFARLMSASNALREYCSPDSGFSQEHIALRDALRVFLELWPRARPVQESQRIMLPFEEPGRQRRGIEAYCYRSIVFLRQRSGGLEACFELDGLNLFRFVKSEWERFRRSKAISSIPGLRVAAGGRSAGFGTIILHGKKYALGEQALMDFVRTALEHAPEDLPVENAGSEWRRFAISDCLGCLVALVERSQPIPSHQIDRFLISRRQRVGRHLVNGRWIFTVSGQGEICAAIDRTLPPSEKRTRPDRGNRRQRARRRC